jgi:ATP-dependent DNA helicase 2 subunit 2
MLHERMSATTSSPEILPSYTIFSEKLAISRLPQPNVVNGTVSATALFIGSSEIDPDQAVGIAVKYSKATMKARVPTLSKAWRPAMDLQAPLPKLGAPASQQYRPASSNQLYNSLAEQSQSQSQGGGIPVASDLAAMISAEVKHHSTYVIRRLPGAPTLLATQATQMTGTQTQTQASQAFATEGLDEDQLAELGDLGTQEEEEEIVDKEDIVKAWRFGSTWVPMEADTFEPLATQKGIEILNFFPRAGVGSIHMRVATAHTCRSDATS